MNFYLFTIEHLWWYLKIGCELKTIVNFTIKFTCTFELELLVSMPVGIKNTTLFYSDWLLFVAEFISLMSEFHFLIDWKLNSRMDIRVYPFFIQRGERLNIENGVTYHRPHLSAVSSFVDFRSRYSLLLFILLCL